MAAAAIKGQVCRRDLDVGDFDLRCSRAVVEARLLGPVPTEFAGAGADWRASRAVGDRSKPVSRWAPCARAQDDEGRTRARDRPRPRALNPPRELRKPAVPRPCPDPRCRTGAETASTRAAPDSGLPAFETLTPGSHSVSASEVPPLRGRQRSGLAPRARPFVDLGRCSVDVARTTSNPRRSNASIAPMASTKIEHLPWRSGRFSCQARPEGATKQSNRHRCQLMVRGI